MSFILGQMKYHLDGKKELTAHQELLKIDAPSVVKIPLIASNVNATLLVKEGDYVKVGTKIAERNDHFYVPIYSSISGTVKGVEKLMHTSFKLVEHLVIENDGKYEAVKPFEKFDYENADHKQIESFIKEAGIVGLGGAGFPTFVKYMSPEKCDTLIINAVECEPYITADYRYILDNIEDFVYGVRALLKYSTAKHCYIGIKNTKKDLIEKVEEAFKGINEISVASVPDAYPMGWEKTLVYEITKKRYKVLPIEAGCIVSNASSAIAVSKAMRNGEAITQKVVTVSGEGIKEPRNVLCYIGTPAKYLVEACGGYTADDLVMVAGGPMMGTSMNSDDFVVNIATNAITVVKDSKFDDVACLRCGSCSDNCPSGLQPVRINNAAKVKDYASLEKLDVMSCVSCGLCSYVCPSKLMVSDNVKKAKQLYSLHVNALKGVKK